MSAIAPITINDGAATPLAHTYNPVSSAPIALFRDTVASLPLVGQCTIAVSEKLDSGSGLNKVRVVLNVPVVETIGTVGANGYVAGPKVAFSVKANVDFILPSRSTMQNRKDLRVMLTNLLANAQIVDTIDNLAPPY